MEKQELIPTQQIGQQTDAEEEKILVSTVEAKATYQKVVQHLLDVNEWYRISTIEASCFKLFDQNGSPLNRAALEGDYIRIDIPGPGTAAGKGFDWVYIEQLEKYADDGSDIDFTLFVARPSRVPGIFGGKIAHFFTDRATSTFIVFRRANVLSVEVHGRNEVPNTQDQNLLDKTRNLVVNGGSTIGMSFAQWHLLVSGILKQTRLDL
ncbi:hypothetical protein EZ456_13285 [Pedobacter psychrodurus]|uniref:Uncharacterized protein n=1 Tax=Pedobacter psychrodurus TaxID=2530456 RepID=A0A4R0Q1N5_9SPHI|nr:hypothetical protein [Pedobacter psychrodurus]TCD26557.1 hypothetical protein EZ456_13285 [Pedobacter psychrodurus]